MLAFSKKFFLGETRDGFYIEPMMKCAWAAQLEVLATIEQICNKYGLQYFADWGTLLGAVRHKGFVPWDDDIDISMLREDYDKFTAVAEKELPIGYRLFSLDTCAEWNQAFMRVVNADSISHDEERLKKFHGCPYSVGIDIFPLDELPEDPQLENYHTELFSTVFSSGRLYETTPSDVEAILPDLEDLCQVQIDRNRPIQNQLFKLADSIAKEYHNSGSPFITTMGEHTLKRLILRKEWFANSVYLPFEHFELPAPSGYDAVLTAEFGDYMIPVRDTACHDYPFYKQQQLIYEQALSSGKATEKSSI